MSRATRSILRLTPYGLFAIAASATGTLSLEQLGRLQVYLVTYVAVALLFSLWVLPGLIAAVTPIRIGEMFGLTRDAFLTAFVAGDLFIVLPALIEASRTLLARHVPESHEATELPDVLVPASFNFPHTGKLLSLSFILFAGWFADTAVAVRDYPQLAVTGLLTFFGSLNAAVPFLLDLFRIPADTFQLFLASGVINSRVGALVAAVHTVTVALLGTLRHYRHPPGAAPPASQVPGDHRGPHGRRHRWRARRVRSPAATGVHQGSSAGRDAPSPSTSASHGSQGPAGAAAAGGPARS